MLQDWRDLLFVHWVVDAELVQSLLPEGLFVECYEGQAYVGVVPFRMERIRFEWLSFLSLGGLCEFNLRTYVRTAEGVSGVYFLTLESNHALANVFARARFGLPYAFSRIGYEVGQNAGNLVLKKGAIEARLKFSFEGEAVEAAAGSLDAFLLERYRFLVDRRWGLYTGELAHAPYSFVRAHLEEADLKGICELYGLPELIADEAAHCVFVRGVDVNTLGFGRV